MTEDYDHIVGVTEAGRLTVAQARIGTPNTVENWDRQRAAALVNLATRPAEWYKLWCGVV